MSHLGPFASYQRGDYIRVVGKDVQLKTGWYAASPGSVCRHCGSVLAGIIQATACNPECVNCNETEREHINGKCLFAPTKFEPVTYIVSVNDAY